MSPSVAVDVAALTRTFGDFTAVDHVSFSVWEGEIFGFLGPNGAGKTTTIRMLSGLLLPTSGSGMVAGYDIARDSESIKRRIGYMSQLFSLYGDLTVEENIDFFAGLYGVGRQELPARRDWALSMAHLTDQRRRLTAELPLGWKQRLALGCAVLHQPKLLFLDEPTSGVDPISRRSFWDLIHALTHEGTTVLVSTHYMEEAEYCHRLSLMNRGRLIALDTPSALRKQMVEPILEIDTDDGTRAVEALRGLEGVQEAGLFGRAVHVVLRDTAPERQEAVGARLRERGVPFRRMTVVSPSLEDVFIARIRAEGGAPTE
ncbi:MAG: ABC transporter ATP-binding protein [Candidatus Zixiibacteriota bacterium]